MYETKAGGVDGERWGGTERSALGTSKNQLKLKSKHFIILIPNLLGLGSRSESAFPSRGGSPPPVEVPFGLPWWRTKLSNTQPCRWCPFPPSTLTSANSKQLLFSNPFLLLNEGQQAASSLSRRSLVLPKPLKKKYFLRGCPSASLHPRLSTPVSPPFLCFFTRRKERTEEQKRAQV